jgi:tripartite ATP-independent transporter DctM subunit
METIETTAIIMFVVASASAFAWILTSNRVTEDFAHLILGVSDSPVVILLMVNVLLFAVGCFMETLAAITILVPVLLPTMMKIGVDPVHFGVIMVLNLMIGLLTPPVGLVLYVLARVSGLPFERTVAATSPFLVPLLVVLFLVVVFPQISMFLPHLIWG